MPSKSKNTPEEKAEKPVDANKKHYFDKLKEAEVLSILGEMVQSESYVVIWPRGQSETDAEDYKAIQFDAATKQLTLQSSGGLLKSILGSKLKDTEVFVKIRQDKYHYFTTAPFKYDSEKKAYVLTCNMDFYRSQQRTHYRLMASRAIVIQIKLSGQVYEGLDISAGGTSFLTTPEQAEIFQKDRQFTEVMLRITKRTFSLGAVRIAGTWPAKNEAGEERLKVGVQFTKIASFTEEEMCQHINSEARGEEIRKKLEK